MDEADNYPHPNPHFPVPPRPVAHLGCIGILLAGVVALLSLVAAAMTISMDQPFLTLAAVLAFVAGAIAVPLMALERHRSRQWRRCRIVPVRITRGPLKRGPGPVFVLLSFAPGIGILAGVLGGLLGRKDTLAHGLVCIGDYVHEIRWEAGRHFRKFREITDVWMLLDDKQEVWPIEGRAPRTYWFQPVSQDAIEYLDEVIPEEFQQKAAVHREALLEADFREAAKANTRAMRRAERYSKFRT